MSILSDNTVFRAEHKICYTLALISGSTYILVLIMSICFSFCGQPDKSLARPGRKQATATEDFVSYILFIIIIGGILVLFIYVTRLASNEIFSP